MISQLSTVVLSSVAVALFAAVSAQDNYQDRDVYRPTQSPDVSFICPELDGQFAGDSCDTYFRCTDGVAVANTCPDGLIFKPDRPYPCVYPQEYSCGTRSGKTTSPGVPGECSRSFALFRSPVDPADCATYTSCVNGEGFIKRCDEGLAYDDENLICNYADMVATCDVEAYLGHSCQQLRFGENEIGLYRTEANQNDCTKYFTCLNHADGSVLPRLHSCPQYTVYDQRTGACSTTPDLVPGCENVYPTELLEALRDYSNYENKQQ